MRPITDYQCCQCLRNQIWSLEAANFGDLKTPKPIADTTAQATRACGNTVSFLVAFQRKQRLCAKRTSCFCFFLLKVLARLFLSLHIGPKICTKENVDVGEEQRYRIFYKRSLVLSFFFVYLKPRKPGRMPFDSFSLLYN
jgi:hypothetical protein